MADFKSKDRHEDKGDEFVEGLAIPPRRSLGAPNKRRNPLPTELVLLESEPEGLHTLIAR
jgi:hypothetical protein